ncbi:unnamed protein product [Orchesella dallaii]|uniref:Heme-binding protein 2 n=1 Tax=Orchesella dallaii TaxID=48710 RepID=A0ABP1Q2P6_9HEXA
MNMSYQRSFAFGAIFVLVLCSSVGQAQLLPIFDWVRSFFGNYEEPPYQLVANLSDTIEERIYPAKRWACTEQFLTPKAKDTKRSEMFMSLFAYIQGKNDGEQKIDMTVPVTTKVDHRNGDLYSYEMCFFIPQEFQANPPRPENRNVRVVSFPELHVYSIRYGGYSTQELEQEQMTLLTTTLKNASIPYFEENQGPRATYFVSGYDSPTKFWSRRNEVWVLGKDNKPLPTHVPSVD